MESYKRIFASGDALEWLTIHKPYGTTIRPTRQGDGFVIAGTASSKRNIDEFVAKHASDPAVAS